MDDTDLRAAFANLSHLITDLAAKLPTELAAAARAQSRGEPTDPRERALWLRRHRNHGPAPRGRHR